MTQVTSKTMLTYLYYVECNKDNLKVYNMILNKIKPNKSYEEINEWASNNIELLNNTICITDDDYPYKNKPANFLIKNLIIEKKGN